jgi:protein O-GlcNAc transferase
VKLEQQLKKGLRYHQLEDLEKARKTYEQILEIDPTHADTLNLLGLVAYQTGDMDQAVVLINKAIENQPECPIYYSNMALVFNDLGKPRQAISCCQKALELRPDYADAHKQMGNALQAQERFEEALLSHEKALELNPEDVEGFIAMGNAYFELGRSSEAISCYEQAIVLEPDLAEAYSNMGNAYREKGEPDKAVACCQKAVELDSGFVGAYFNLGNAFLDQGQLEGAAWCYRRALELDPEDVEVCSALVHTMQETCDWQDFEGFSARLDMLTKRALEAGRLVSQEPMLNIARVDDVSQNFVIAKSYSDFTVRRSGDLGPEFSHAHRRRDKPNIHIGYLSNCFGDHPMAHLSLGLYGLHDRKGFQVSCYSHGQDDGSYYRRRIERECDRFVDLDGLNDQEAAKRVEKDQVDILVDLKGHTEGNRLALFSLRPAPIQVRFLGLPGTTGADFFDYIITDRIITPEEHSPFFSERFVYMPHCYQVNDHRQGHFQKGRKRTDFGLPEGPFSFCSFNQSYKIESSMFHVWMKILQQVPQSLLWLQQCNDWAEKNIRREAEARDVKGERIIFADRIPKADHLARMALADLALDTRIYNGHTTTSDTLWAGVPVITLLGSHFASRVSASILRAINLPELIVERLEDYESRAVELATNPEKLSEVRQKVWKNRLNTPLFDTPRFVKNLERAYREMWKIFMEGAKPRQIEVVES